jgi:cysteinyl-tRNA synthetase
MMKRVVVKKQQVLITILMVVGILLSSACSSQVPSSKSTAKSIGISMQEQKNTAVTSSAVSAAKTTPAPEKRRPWSQIHNWAYWLDNPDLKKLGASNFELLVIDYSADGSAQRAFTAQQITALRKSACQRRIVAYLSIGQAEAYRGYWQQGWKAGNPSWLGEADPDWEQNYWVRYWDAGWQQIMYRYIDTIIAAGFDGIYLDRVDAYQENYATGHEGDMVNFVLNIAHYARAHSPLKNDFGIFVQNAEDLAPDHADYVNEVTGIGREEVYVYATNQMTSRSEQNEVEQNLSLFQQKGKLVLTVDYASTGELIKQTYERALARKYIPYVTDVGLDRLQMNKGYEPVCQPF